MRIAVNARFLLKDRLEGLGRFSHEVLKRMVQNHPEHEFLFLFDRPFHPDFVYGPNVKPVHVFPPARHPYLYPIWFNWGIPRYIHKWQANVFFSPDGFLSHSIEIPQVPVIHDLAFEHYPQYVSKAGANYYKRNFPVFAKRAKRIATVSEFSKSDILQTYGIQSEKIDVVYNGASSVFKRPAADVLTEFKNANVGEKPYFVYVGSLHPRKNIGKLLQAFDRFKELDSLHYQLIIIGRKAWQTEEMERVFESMKYKADVHFTGRIPDEEVVCYLSAAKALTYIPVFEGFGLPVLEALQCGTPVISSNLSSLPEVAGSAGLLVNPFSVEEIAEAMTQVANDEELYQGLLQACKAQSEKFSWDKTAEACWQCLLAAL